ncbi:MAG: MBL fold metallo-hydrolase [Deltaproteobacteria bacterium]|nr:MBL fold metallo-hydrolase [Deltaproteobacteria bacterium]
MYVQQFFVDGLAHCSYLLGASSTCAIVDPMRDVQVYLDAAKARQLSITHVVLTHLHADFVGGHRELADVTGATVCAPAAGRCSFPHVGVDDGMRVVLEEVELQVMATPGHSPDSVCCVAVDRGRSDDPVAVFTGDTLFVGEIGRPDLFPGQAAELAGALFDSLHNRLLKLPDYCAVLPGHGAGSLCGRAIGQSRQSTIGYERRNNSLLHVTDRSLFVERLTRDPPDLPDHFGRCCAANAAGPPLLRELAVPRSLPPRLFEQELRRSHRVVVDTRGCEAFAGQHIVASLHLDLEGNFSLFAGWLLAPEQEILLVVDSASAVPDALTRLRRVGLDRVVGYLEGGMPAWTRAGFPTGHLSLLSAAELRQRVQAGSPMQMLDVRSRQEFLRAHVEGALNIPLPDLRSRHGELSRQVPIAIVCASGHRASTAASLVQPLGLHSIAVLAGGLLGYHAAGYGPECPVCHIPHGPAAC